MGSHRQIFQLQVAPEIHLPSGSIQTRTEKEKKLNEINVKALSDASAEIWAKLETSSLGNSSF